MVSDAELLERLNRLSPQELADLDSLLTRPDTPLFRDWLPLASPTYHWDWPHLRLIQDHLQALYRGDIQHLMVLCPPRHGKSEQNSIRFPVYWLEQHPETRIIVASYAQTLAAKFTRKARTLARQRGIQLNEERKAADDWETVHGGGMRGAGVGTGVAGTGANLLVVDDPIKDRAEAESELVRDSTWIWVQDDLFTRREPKARTLWTYTPWNLDDAGQRLLNSPEAKHWTVLRLPAEAEPNDPLGRAEHAPLCPERYDAEALGRIKATMTAYSWSALFQCHPVPRTGNMFPEDRVQIVDAVPSGLKWVRYWDNAGTEGGSGAQTAGVKLAQHKGLYYVADCEAFRLEAAAVEARQKTTAEMDGYDTTHWLEQEPGSAGKAAKSTFIRNMAPYPAYGAPASGDKVTRAEGWAAQWQAGNVRLLRGEWNASYIREHGSFPVGRTKDKVDASSGAFHKVAAQPKVVAPLLDLVKDSHWS